MGKGAREASAAPGEGEEEGWYDDDGFWFEPAADGSDGYYDCYTPEGNWYQTGSYDEDGEWIQSDGYYDSDGKWHDGPAPTDASSALPGQISDAPAPESAQNAPAAAGDRGAAKRLRDVETNENGEQGYWHKGKWVCTGWYDAAGYWFEEAGEFDEDGHFVANGYHDCYDPSGTWCETGAPLHAPWR